MRVFEDDVHARVVGVASSTANSSGLEFSAGDGGRVDTARGTFPRAFLRATSLFGAGDLVRLVRSADQRGREGA